MSKCKELIKKIMHIDDQYDINKKVIEKREISKKRFENHKKYIKFKNDLIIDDEGVKGIDPENIDASLKEISDCSYDIVKDHSFDGEADHTEVTNKKDQFIKEIKKTGVEYDKTVVLNSYEDFIRAYDLLESKIDRFLQPDDVDREVDQILKQIFIIRLNENLKDKEDAQELTAAQLKLNISKEIKRLDEEIQKAFDDTLHNPEFQQIEANWRGIDEFLSHVDFSKNIKIDLLDVTKDELRQDFKDNPVDISNTEFFKKIYFKEYDQYGGLPYGCVVGLYEFENSKEDKAWLEVMGKTANASHFPFVASVGPTFFGCKDITELSRIKDLKGLMNRPMFDRWNDFRDSDEAAYIGLTVPRYMVRPPYDTKSNSIKGLNYIETITRHEEYLWASAAFLFARNLVNSFEETQWCQTIRGPKNGGMIQHLPRHRFYDHGLEVTKMPAEMVIPDFAELAFADCGFIPLVVEKGTSNACFFSSQSIKKARKFKDPKDSENSQLVTNLSYTFSITKIAHYIKCIMRDNIGGTADAAFITKVIDSWLSNYVTVVVNPDDLTLRNYPFKAIAVDTFEREGMIGWYDCKVKIKPHIQFEGFDAELQLEVRL